MAYKKKDSISFPSGEIRLVSPQDFVLRFFSLRRLRRATEKRRRCLLGVLSRRGPPPGGDGGEAVHHRGGGRGDSSGDPGHCLFRRSLRRKARTCVRFFETEFRLKRASALPSRIQCGYLRSAVRSCFGLLSPGQELSIKTSQKLERYYCKHCSGQVSSDFVERWKKGRFKKERVDNDHLQTFQRQLARNVPVGWNTQGSWPYIPNGHATAYHSRCEGGNWNVEPDDDHVEVTFVVSSGKPRIVTAYAAGRTEVLYPLHKALYATLRKKGWLLVGKPTNERVASLNGQEYISVDYSSATDNIKTAYTRAAVEVLIQRGVGLDEQQVRALRSVGQLCVDGVPALIGQPMGSMMSFPLLCLINKTVVDLADNDLLEEGEISFKEWTGHRHLINGDDLLLRSPVEKGEWAYLPRLVWHGGQVGLVINKEKTMVSTTLAEVNSTLFEECVEEKKSNVAALFPGKEVSDIVGYVDRSVVDDRVFCQTIQRFSGLLSQQVVKCARTLSRHRWRLFLGLSRTDPAVRDAILNRVSEQDHGNNAFPVVPRPEGYDLTPWEEKASIESRVSLLRSRSYKTPYRKATFRQEVPFRSLREALKKRKPASEDNILKVLEDSWKERVCETLSREDVAQVDMIPDHVCDECSGRPRVFQLVCEMRAFKQRKWVAELSLRERNSGVV